jgi:hypothetical protein
MKILPLTDIFSSGSTGALAIPIIQLSMHLPVFGEGPVFPAGSA